MTKLSIHMVTWNSKPFLVDCLYSIYQQTYKDFSLTIIDNNSSDGSPEIIKEVFPKATILRNVKNLGFARAHNQAMRLSKSEYVLVTNVDIVLEKHYLATIMALMDRRKSVGSATGKLYRFEKLTKAYEIDEPQNWGTLKSAFQGAKESLTEQFKTAKILDSTGLQPYKSRQFRDRGAGEKDTHQYDDLIEIFGCSGALACYRREALESTRFNDEYFDELFHSYKEDVDLAWRLQLTGWKSAYIPQAIALHKRNISENGGTHKKIIEGRKRRSNEINRYSYRNHIIMLYKNSFIINVAFALPWIILYELKKLIYILIFEKNTLKGIADIVEQRKIINAKRKKVKSSRVVTAKYMRLWFS